MPKPKKITNTDSANTELLCQIDSKLERFINDHKQSQPLSPQINSSQLLDIKTKLSTLDENMSRILSIITTPDSLIKNVIAKSIQRVLNPLFAMLRQVKKALQLPKRPPGPARSAKVQAKRDEKQIKRNDFLATAHPRIDDIDDNIYDDEPIDEPIEEPIDEQYSQNDEEYISNDDNDEIELQEQHAITTRKMSAPIATQPKPLSKFNFLMKGKSLTDATTPEWVQRIKSIIPFDTPVIITSLLPSELHFTIVTSHLPRVFEPLNNTNTMKIKIQGNHYTFRKVNPQ